MGWGGGEEDRLLKTTKSVVVVVAVAETWSESSDVALIDRPHTGTRHVAYTGPSVSLLVTRTGYVHAWKFYSRTDGTATFQVYRPKTQLVEHQ